MLDEIAVKMGLSPEELERASLRLFLTHQLRSIETQLLGLGHKYGVRTVSDLDNLVQTGRIHEAEAFEDYFDFDHLEAERDTLLEALKALS